jgi:hypothetical protein
MPPHSTRQSDTKSDDKKTEEEAHVLHELLGVHGQQDHKEEVMKWDHGDLSLIKGITVDSTFQKKSGKPSNRRVLKHMRFDKKSGQFVPSQQRKLNRLSVSVKLDQDNLSILRKMLDHASGTVGEESRKRNCPTMK